MQFAAKRQRTAIRGVDDADYLVDSRPQRVQDDPPAIIAALAANPLGTADAFSGWVRGLPDTKLDLLKNDIQDTPRTGNLRFIASKLVPHMVEMQGLAVLKARTQMSEAYLHAIMVRSMQTCNLNQTTLSEILIKEKIDRQNRMRE